MAVSNHPVHPWYGPCDSLADGECAECTKEITRFRAALATARAEERERCAKVAENCRRWKGKIFGWQMGTAVNAASVIRAMKDDTNG